VILEIGMWDSRIQGWEIKKDFPEEGELEEHGEIFPQDKLG
jgi:hypothetical protein